VPDYIKSFEEAGLRTLLLENIKASGYTKPTPVQRGAIPCILKRRDVMACAVTGSGKTVSSPLPHYPYHYCPYVTSLLSINILN